MEQLSILDEELMLPMTVMYWEMFLISFSPAHSESIHFHLLSSPQVPVILGDPWLRLHNPHVDRETGVIRDWSKECTTKRCLCAFVPVRPEDIRAVPEKYADFYPVFRKTQDSTLNISSSSPGFCAISVPLTQSRNSYRDST